MFSKCSWIFLFVLLPSWLKISHQRHVVLLCSFPFCKHYKMHFFVLSVAGYLVILLHFNQTSSFKANTRSFVVTFHFQHLHLQVSCSVRSSQLSRCAPTAASSPQKGQKSFCSCCLSPRQRPCPSLWGWIRWVWIPRPTPSALSQVCFCL